MKILIQIVAIVMILSTTAFAGEAEKGVESISWNLFFIVLSGVLGYIVGAIKSFREEKQKAYGEIIPPILKMAYNPQDAVDEKEYSKALSKLWLYGSKRVTEKMETALEIMHNPSKGDVTRAQEAVVEMRNDIQLFSLRRLRPEDVNHLYTRIAGAGIDNSKFEALREIKAVISNIPPHLSRKELEDRLKNDQEFQKSLSHRLVGLFGLRNELIPYIEPEIMDLIDKQLEPLFIIENGSYTLRTERIPEFAAFAENIKLLVTAIEEKYMKKIKDR
jgi:hypothetical protein